MTRSFRCGKGGQIILLFAVTYMISYVTRVNYGAVISEMEIATAIPRNLLSVSLTGSFITYGIGQIISGILGDRVSPKLLIFIGFVTTSLMNILLPLCPSPEAMIAVWCLNGFAQSLMWPPLVRLISTLFDSQQYKKATTRVSWGSSAGTVAVYLISPLLIKLFSWRAVFFVSGISGAVMALFWLLLCPDVKNEKQSEENTKRSYKGLFSPVMATVMVAIVLMGIIRDGVTTWMPSYISGIYGISNIAAILSGVLLPVFGVVCYNIANSLYSRKFDNPVLCAAIIFVPGVIAAGLLFAFSGQNSAVSVIMSAILAGSMHGVNLMLVCMIPRYFERYGSVSTVSGVLNSCTYVGSALSGYGVAAVSLHIGWNFTLLIWFAVALLGCLLCFVSFRAFKRRMS